MVKHIDTVSGYRAKMRMLDHHVRISKDEADRRDHEVGLYRAVEAPMWTAIQVNLQR